MEADLTDVEGTRFRFENVEMKRVLWARARLDSVDFVRCKIEVGGMDTSSVSRIRFLECPGIDQFGFNEGTATQISFEQCEGAEQVAFFEMKIADLAVADGKTWSQFEISNSQVTGESSIRGTMLRDTRFGGSTFAVLTIEKCRFGGFLNLGETTFTSLGLKGVGYESDFQVLNGETTKYGSGDRFSAR